MLDLVEVHERLYLFLIEQRKYNSELNFTFRKSNIAHRLEEGYWFYGNENYLAISFWDGMDWKNRTPNICFIIDSLGKCMLEINVSDSSIKKEFIERYFLQRTLKLEKVGRRYVSSYNNDYSDIDEKKYDENNYMSVLEYFLDTDKKNIDDIVKNNSDFFSQMESKENAISFIDSAEFKKRFNKIKQYRKLKQEFDSEDDYSIKEDKPGKLLSININDYGLIKNLSINIKSKKNQWIFLTGENGSGKTNLLRAIATTLGNRMLSRSELTENPAFDVEAEFLFKNKIDKYIRSANGGVKGKRKPYIQGLAMYGPYRLDMVLDKVSKVMFKKELNKEESFKSLFKVGTPLLSIDKQFEFWRSGTKREKDLFQKREYFIKSLIVNVVDNLIDIRFTVEGGKKITKYIFVNDQNQEYPLVWEKLSTGTKSTIAMLGDILIRLFNQQIDVSDPAELRGIVIIDEIDLHLHPKAQKDLVINLSKTFPNIQFIVSSHSPIPFIGAPEESVFITVERDENSDVKATMLDIDISNLLPNTILSSPIFGFDSIINVQHNPNESLITEKDYQEATFYKILNRKITERIITLGLDNDTDK
ncbi:AAA family ATPase [Chryseobacterium sp. Ch-15]|uniref:AAA family ATPase n=1 Tax=Chryseobacterium muglaense TaxID=2893752 RepID=A0A9Q3UUH4_9FLAO|nr:AAA family ATPase [Chryseobacterium muglaense]MBD3906511.1 AAA family ATPase [Chryseobacterium muglaense]MCC9034016.1 AAA family ATPase [Chryseobacterium muglaense]MCM2556219.1 AAA family ATPase [Chryseobacterium muglaense]